MIRLNVKAEDHVLNAAGAVVGGGIALYLGVPRILAGAAYGTWNWFLAGGNLALHRVGEAVLEDYGGTGASQVVTGVAGVVTATAVGSRPGARTVKNVVSSPAMRPVAAGVNSLSRAQRKVCPILIDEGLRRVEQIRACASRSIERGRNVAYLEVDYGLGFAEELMSVSGVPNRVGFVPTPTDRFFGTYVIGHSRAFDTEAKMLEYVADVASRMSVDGGRPVGVIRMFSERPVCNSCRGVIRQFLERFPGWRIVVTESERGMPRQ